MAVLCQPVSARGFLAEGRAVVTVVSQTSMAFISLGLCAIARWVLSNPPLGGAPGMPVTDASH